MSAPLSLTFSFFLGYLLGSVPTAYLLVRWKSHIDIRDAGSGNVGTLNSYLVTNSKGVGATVLLLDLLKGLCAALAAGSIWNGSFVEIALAGVGATLGHTFPVWLGFRGGRGLATAAGVMFAIAWKIVPVWGIFWWLGQRVSRDVNMGNAVACVLTLAVVLPAPIGVLAWFVSDDIDHVQYKYFLAVLLAILLAKLAQPVSEWLRKTHTRG